VIPDLYSYPAPAAELVVNFGPGAAVRARRL
jgi:hypothetical protein